MQRALIFIPLRESATTCFVDSAANALFIFVYVFMALRAQKASPATHLQMQSALRANRRHDHADVALGFCVGVLLEMPRYLNQRCMQDTLDIAQKCTENYILCHITWQIIIAFFIFLNNSRGNVCLPLV